MNTNTSKTLTLMLGIASAALLATPVRAGETPNRSAAEAPPSEAEKLLPLKSPAAPAATTSPSGAAQLGPLTPVSSLEDQQPAEAAKDKETLSSEPSSDGSAEPVDASGATPASEDGAPETTEPASDSEVSAPDGEAKGDEPSSAEDDAGASGDSSMEKDEPGNAEDGADSSDNSSVEKDEPSNADSSSAPAPEDSASPDEDSAAPEESVAPDEGETPPAGPSSSVSDEELQQFANTIPSLKTADQNTQKEIAQVIQSSGLDESRFDQIYQTQQSPEKQTATKVTTEEKKSFEKALSDIEAIEAKGKAKQEEIIEAQGLKPQRFVEILVSLRQDPALRSKMQQLLPK
jgi:hypothetical protein